MPETDRPLPLFRKLSKRSIYLGSQRRRFLPWRFPFFDQGRDPPHNWEKLGVFKRRDQRSLYNLPGPIVWRAERAPPPSLADFFSLVAKWWVQDWSQPLCSAPCFFPCGDGSIFLPSLPPHFHATLVPYMRPAAADPVARLILRDGHGRAPAWCPLPAKENTSNSRFWKGSVRI